MTTNPLVNESEMPPTEPAVEAVEAIETTEVSQSEQPDVAKAYKIFDYFRINVNGKDLRFNYVSPDDLANAKALIVGGEKLQEVEAADGSINEINKGGNDNFDAAKEIAHDAGLETAVAIKGWKQIREFFTDMSGSDHVLGAGSTTPRMLKLDSSAAQYFYERNPGLRGPSKDESSLTASNNNLEFFYALSQSDANDLRTRLAGCEEGDGAGNPFVLKIGQVRFMFLETDMAQVSGVKEEKDLDKAA